ncbi:MAG TPA: FHA domain-containing protein, partial [Blastocatellia bacterium]|nr:FHA domain-containing protein [Blastocatellia bacterium]
GLRHVLTERAKELVGEKEFQTRSIALEVRVDGTLEAGRFRVQHVWDADAQKTIVRPRKRTRPDDEIPEPDEDATVVRPRKRSTPSFTVSVRRVGEGSGEHAEPREFFKDEITIGRGSKHVDVDLQLKGDMEVSRKHATLSKGSDGKFRLTCHGANPILLAGDRELPAGESAELSTGEMVVLSTYELVVG